MAKTKLGIKRLCLNCGKRFYDLQRDPIHCPSCGTKLESTPPGKTRRQRTTVKRVVAPLKENPAKTGTDEEVEQEEGTTEFLGDDIEEELELEVEDENVTEMLAGIKDPKEEPT